MGEGGRGQGGGRPVGDRPPRPAGGPPAPRPPRPKADPGTVDISKFGPGAALEVYFEDGADGSALLL